MNGTTYASSMQRETVVVAGAGFSAGELVGLWLTLPDYSVVGLDDDDLTADSKGEFAVELYLPSGLPTGMHYFSARGQSSGKGGIAPFYLQAGKGPKTTDGTQLTFSPATAAQEETVTLSASGFSAGEAISFWVTLPNGAVVSLGQGTASSSGAFSADIYLSASLPVGRHYFTAFGNSSGNTAISAFVLKYGNGLNVDGAKIAVNVGSAKQRSFLELSGEGFANNETVSFWLTEPDGSVVDIGYLTATSSGAIDGILYLSEELPAGTHYLSVRGDRSGLSGFFKLVLNAGPQDPGKE